jgi:DNA-binding NarL/FixJ family response regulator
MDLDLPEESGIRAIREMREIDSSVCILGLLTYEWVEARRDALRAGARNCVTKDRLMRHLVHLIDDCF